MTDLIGEFNYLPYILDIRGLDKALVRKRLRQSYVNHVYEVDDSDYIVISNCDANGSLCLADAINDAIHYGHITNPESFEIVPFQPYILEMLDDI